MDVSISVFSVFFICGFHRNISLIQSFSRELQSNRLLAKQSIILAYLSKPIDCPLHHQADKDHDSNHRSNRVGRRFGQWPSSLKFHYHSPEERSAKSKPNTFPEEGENVGGRMDRQRRRKIQETWRWGRRRKRKWFLMEKSQDLPCCLLLQHVPWTTEYYNILDCLRFSTISICALATRVDS